jgi:hypothetical protein
MPHWSLIESKDDELVLTYKFGTEIDYHRRYFKIGTISTLRKYNAEMKELLNDVFSLIAGESPDHWGNNFYPEFENEFVKLGIPRDRVPQLVIDAYLDSENRYGVVYLLECKDNALKVGESKGSIGDHFMKEFNQMKGSVQL